VREQRERERERESEIKLGFLAGGGENAREEHLAFLFVCFFFFFLFFFFENVPSYSRLKRGGEEERELKGRNVKNGEEGQLLT
jgi:hypothetical protein